MQELGTTGSCDGPCCDASVTTSTSSSRWQKMATTGSCDDLCCDASVTKSTLSSRWQEMAATGSSGDLCCDASVTKFTSLSRCVGQQVHPCHISPCHPLHLAVSHWVSTPPPPPVSSSRLSQTVKLHSNGQPVGPPRPAPVVGRVQLSPWLWRSVANSIACDSLHGTGRPPVRQC